MIQMSNYNIWFYGKKNNTYIVFADGEDCG